VIDNGEEDGREREKGGGF